MIARVKVLDSRALTPTTHAVRFEKPKGFAFRPVQFCGLEIETDEGGVEYPMSLACSPTRPYLEFGARVTSGSAWKRAFRALVPGDEAEVDGPYGHFVLDESRPAVLVAGGIGITPLKGMAEYAADKKLDVSLRLLYSNRAQDDIPYKDEVDALARQNPRFSVVHTLTRASPAAAWAGRRGRIDAALLEQASADLRDPMYYVCGIPEMVEEMVDTLRRMNVPAGRIMYEGFHGYD